MKTLKKLFFLGGLAALIALPASNTAYAGSPAAREWGSVVDQASQVPDANFTSYIVYATGNDSELHTDWGVDSSGGTSGYFADYNLGVGFFLCALDNLNQSAGLYINDPFTVEFSYYHGAAKERATANGLGPTSYNINPTPVPGFDLTLADDPTLPNKATIAADYNTSTNAISVSWTAEGGVDYDVYISENPSGAGNGRSNGLFYKIADNVQPPYTFTQFDVPYYLSGPKPVEQEYATYYFIVFGQNTSGRSAASNEVTLTTTPPIPPTPSMTTWGILLSLGVLTILLATSNKDYLSNTRWNVLPNQGED